MGYLKGNCRKVLVLPLFSILLAVLLLPSFQVSAAPLPWTQVNSDGFGDPNNIAPEGWVEFNGEIYIGVDNEVTGVEVWRSSDGLTWSQVGDDGFGDSNNAYFWNFEESQSELYASIASSSPSVVRIFKYTAGDGWSQIGSDGLGDSNNTAAYLYNHDSLLIAFTYNFFSGSEIWTWNGSAWTQRMSDGIDGNSNNLISFPLGEFKGYLYMTSVNSINGTGLWRTDDGVNWVMANDYGFGDENNIYVSGMAEYNGYVYAVTYNSATGSEVWRSSDGLTWSQVGDDGFGDKANYMGRTVIFKDNLYVVTFNWNHTGNTPATGVEVWRSSDGLTWSQVNTDGFGDPNNRRGYPTIGGENLYIVTTNNATGVEVWRSSDGETWNQINSDGFGDPNNKRGWVRFTFENHFYVATINEVTGTEVWRLDEALTPPPDFSLAVTPSPVTVQSRSSVTLTLTVSSINGFDSQVALNYSWIDPKPTDVSVTLPETATPPPDANVNVNINIAAGPASTNGTYTLRVTGKNGTLEHYVDVQVEIAPWTGGCLIATAAYGSGLSPEVQFLRDFRDRYVLKTFAGSSFMEAFNAWYYSFSPYVAKVIAGEEWARTLTRITLYPLLAVLHLSEIGYSALSHLNPEVAVIASGFIASTLLGLIYLTPPTILILRKIRAKNGWAEKSFIKSVFLVWMGSLILIAVSELYEIALLGCIGTVTFVLATITAAGVGAAIGVMDKPLFKRLRRDLSTIPKPR